MRYSTLQTGQRDIKHYQFGGSLGLVLQFTNIFLLELQQFDEASHIHHRGLCFQAIAVFLPEVFTSLEYCNVAIYSRYDLCKFPLKPLQILAIFELYGIVGTRKFAAATDPRKVCRFDLTSYQISVTAFNVR